METPDQVRLSDALTRLALSLLNEPTLRADLERLARLACDLIPACSGASVSMMVDGEPSTVATTNRVALQLDMAQYEHDEGPCVMALGGEAVRIGFIPLDERFPHFAIGAADRRVLSVQSSPAVDHGHVVGSLNIYSRRAEAFDEVDQAVARIIAAEVATALIRSAVFGTATDIRDRLQEQYDADVLVSRAQGILMEVQDCSVAQAADLLRNAANRNGEPILATAERILSSVHHPAVVTMESDRSEHD